MKKKPVAPSSSLRLNRETLRQLTGAELANAAGASTIVHDTLVCVDTGDTSNASMDAGLACGRTIRDLTPVVNPGHLLPGGG